MTLEQVRLDDLTWADLMADIRAAIPAESLGEYTLHAPVDPGITLLELYASELEERLYWLDQVPDSLVRGILKLLGVPPPRPAVAAATLLAFAGGGIGLAVGRALSSPGQAGRVELTIDDPLAVVEVTGLAVRIDGVDRTADLARASGSWSAVGAFGALPPSGAGVDLLRSAGGYADAEIDLVMPAAAMPPADGDLALGLVIQPDGDVPAEWAPDAVDGVPKPAEVVWGYRDGSRIVDFPEVRDGTGHLRRSGVVRLRWPDAWRMPGGAADVTRQIVVRTDDATFAAPPRVLAIVPNAVTARHRRAVASDADAALATDLAAQAGDWLPLPRRALDVPGAAGRLRDDPETIRLEFDERDGSPHIWKAAADLSFAGPADRLFVIDRERGRIEFGDGLAGRIPVPARDAAGAARTLRLGYEVGAGDDGNQGAGSIWETIDAPARTARNVVSLAGGADPESVAAARARAGAELARRYRAVTAGDYATVAMEKERLGLDVARVHVGVGRHPWFPCSVVPGAVTLVIVPEVRRDPASGLPVVATPHPDPGMLAAVRNRMETARLVGSEVYVVGPTYRRIHVVVTVAGGVADTVALHTTLVDALTRHLDPLAGAGGDGWPFGAPLRPSELFGVAQDAAGTGATVEGVAIGIDGESDVEDCDDVPLRDHELPALAAVELRVDQASRPDGGLR